MNPVSYLQGNRALRLFLCLSLLSVFSPLTKASTDPQQLISRYIDGWKAFYPSAALAYGDAPSAYAFEDYATEAVTAWLELNATTASDARTALAADPLNAATRIDLQVLLGQAEDELATWTEDQPLTRQPQWYAEQVSQALTHLLVRDQLPDLARTDALMARLAGVRRLCEQATLALTGGNALRTATALRTLAGTRAFYDGNLRTLTAAWPAWNNSLRVEAQIDAAIAAIKDLEQHLEKHILPRAPTAAGIGEAPYAAKLARRAGNLYTPATLLQAAGAEMREVRALMQEQAARWQQTTAATPASVKEGELLDAALEAMESDREDNSADFLTSFSTLTYAAERFVEEQQLATVPKPTTLTIALSPAHFSGAAVGGVYPTGPFAKEADTIFYVPSIPDAASAEAREGFYRSFNTHFNTMIMSHEMFPGHYLQYKVAINNAPDVRSLFANGSYVEGWGSFSEELMLDAGWAGNAPLTRLAHLRKRLENATRAYVSVQVNTAGWGETEVLAFARDEGLLAPQFAQNLWQRVVNSPLQITDYFTGYRHFRRLYASYVAGHSGGPRPWVDAVLQAGPLPMALLEEELQR